MTLATLPNDDAPRRVLSLRATIILIAGAAFCSMLLAGVTLAVRVVPKAAQVSERGAAARKDYAARSTQSAQLDSSMSDIWRLLRRARVAPIPADSLAVRRERLERIVRSVNNSAQRPIELSTSTEFGMGLERADLATVQVAASMLGAIGATEIGDLVLADRLMSRADSLDAPLKARLYEVTEIALTDLATEEQRLERDTRFAARLMWGWLLVFLLAGPFFWRLLQRRLMQPLDRFVRALDRVQGGDLAVEIPLEYDDELGRLGAHFNRTTNVLRSQRTEGETRAAQKALETSEARYREAFEQAAVGLAEITVDGTLQRVNRTVSRMFGDTTDALPGRRLLEFAHPEEADTLAAAWPRVLSGETLPTRVDRRFVRADGSVTIAQVTTTVMRRTDGSARYVLAVIHDITDQRRLERELMQTTKLEAVGQLAGGVAHDFNNILAGIVGYAELLEENPANAVEVREDAASIKRAALKGADLSRSLLTLARRNTRREDVFLLDDMLLETRDFVRRTFDRRVEVLLSVEKTLPVRGDRSLLSNAVLNLAVNARDAMPNGGTIRIHGARAELDAAFRDRHSLSADARYAAISVSDTGEGMTQEIIERVFEPFFTTKPPDKGTGLGLAMVYGTVKDHQGTVTISSTLGEGTTVSLYIPYSADTVTTPLSAPAPVTARSPSRILVVDDEAMVRNVAKRLLERLGYLVETAEDGLEAVARLERDDPGVDLVIIDGNMPRLDGMETARRIHARHPTLSLLFATGHFDPAARENLAALGFTDQIDKPFSLEVFADTVARCLAR